MGRKKLEGVEIKVQGRPAKRSLGHFVYETVKRMIIKGELKPGTRLVESRIASQLKISRTPIREAFQRLQKEGFLKKNMVGAVFVSDLTKEDIEETFGIRCVLESYAARLATLRYTKRDLQALEKKVQQYEEALEKGDLELLPKINTEFHELLYKFSKSPKLINMIHELRDQIHRFREVILKAEGMAQQSKEDHRKMLELMAKGDAEGVEKVVKEHILRGKDLVIKLLKKEKDQR